jgi:hypothetical protein
VAFLKFSRDKRGYENFYLMQPSARGKSRPRLLYWFRTPPGVKVGRTPFDSDVRRALEAQNPDVAFDWTAIVQTPIPAADTERWRERRRVERAMRAASDAENADEGREPDAGPVEAGRAEPETASPVAETPTTVTEAATAALPVHSVISVLSVPLGEREAIATDGPAPASNVSSPAGETAPGGHTRRRKRRRRGRRKAQQVPGSGFQVPDSEGPAREASPVSDPTASGAEAPDPDDDQEP